MRSKVLFSLLTVCFALSGAMAQQTPRGKAATLTFADDREREVWFQPAPPTGPTASSIRTGKSLVELDLAKTSPGEMVYIWDHQSGNLAAIKPADISKGGMTLAIGADAFNLVAQVAVRLEHNGQGIAAADVSISEGHGVSPRSQLLDPSGNGVVKFFGVHAGSLTVNAKFNAKDGTSRTVTQLLDLALTRKDPVPTLVISVADDVATLGTTSTSTTPPVTNTTPAATTAGAAPVQPTTAGATPPPAVPGPTPKPAAAAEGGGNPLGSIFGYLLGLAIVGGIIYFGYRYTTNNKDLVQNKLTQLGVDIPKAGDDPHTFDPVSAPVPKRPEPPQKIILDNAAPDPIGYSAPSNPVSSGISAGVPRLIADTGDTINLPDGETIVGRDVGLGLSLVGETSVSRRHAQMTRIGNEVTLVDLGSTNGTYVNGNPVRAPLTLRSGDAIQFGSSRFRFES